MASESVHGAGVSAPKILWSKLLLLFLLGTICLNLIEARVPVKSARFGFKHLPVGPLVYFKESDNILYHDYSGTVWISTDAGGKWKEVDGVPNNKAGALIQHPFSKDKAYILTTDKIHYKTSDKGITWKEFTTSTIPAKRVQVLSFHAGRENYVLYRGSECKSWFECTDVTYYTNDNFDTYHKLNLENTDKCIWAHNSDKFDEAPTDSIFCIQYDVSGSGSTRKLSDYRLVESEDYFDKSTNVIDFNSGGDVRGVIGLGETQEFLVAAVKDPNTLDLKMYVSRDGLEWARAFFPLNKGPLKETKEEAYTILESPTDHMVVDLLSSESLTGSLFTSNSNGTYFVNRLNHTHRNKEGYVDFRLSQSVGGILIANIVYNYEDIKEIDDEKIKLQSKISFDDGITWKFINPPEKKENGHDFLCKDRGEKKCSLHLHSVTSAHNYGRIFSSNAPGVLMGVGHVGEYLLPYDQCDTFLSYDGGVTWKNVKLGAYMYAIGHYGSILVMIDDEQPTDFILYSSDRGKSWNKMDLDNQRTKIRAKYLITDPESTSKNFLLLGSTVPDGSNGNRHFIFKLDFSELFDRNCNDDDFDNFVLKRGTESDCFMGKTTTYHRRNADSRCFVSKVPDPVDKTCACTDNDYECDFNYIFDKDGKTCLPLLPEKIPDGECEDGQKTYKGSSGFRLIPESGCDPDREDSVKHNPVDRECHSVPLYGEISHRTYYFTIDSYYFYFPESSILMIKTTDGKVKRSEDEGSTWEDVLIEAGSIAYMRLHDHNGDRAYFFPDKADESDNKYYMWYTLDRGKTFDKHKLEKEPNKLNLNLLDFHPKHEDRLLFMASTSCPGCHSIAYFSGDNGKTWAEIETWAEKCIFGVDTDFSGTEDDAVFCSSYKDKNSKISQDELGGRTSEANPLQLAKFIIDSDGNNGERKFLLDDIVNFFIFDEFMAVATEEHRQLLLYTSRNGSTFTKVSFPPNLIVDKQAYTILPSTTGSIFLDVYKSISFGYGSLFKSNSNGTAFNRILDNTNRNTYGNVDFEKVPGLDGIILANQVENIDELSEYVKKKIISKISYDDGSHWKRLKMNNECQDDCYLNLHGRTDVYVPDSIFSAPSAIGLLMGVGNIGSYLLPYEKCNTYMSRDAGRTWKEIRHGSSLYEFGDQGTIIVVVEDVAPTDHVLYSWNYGEDWSTYKFTSNPIKVVLLTTNSNSTSMKFFLYGYSIHESSPVVVTIDFSQLEKKKCEKDDFELWNPMDEHSDDHKCLLGQKVKYHRRKAGRECHIGEFKITPPEPEPCPCTKHDFECADGYWRNTTGDCELMGPDPDRPANCQGKYKGHSGYVKMEKSKCKGGLNLDKMVDKNCKSGNNIIISKTTTLSQRIADYFYFNETKTILALTMDNVVWKGTNEGHTWETPKKLEDVKIYAILQHPYFNDHAYCISRDKIFYTSDSGNNFEEITVPMDPNNLQLPILNFHPDKHEYLIYTGSINCESISSADCHTKAFYTTNNGNKWESIEEYVRTCQWARNKKFKVPKEEDLIICESYRDKSGSQLLFYDNPLQFLYFSSFKNKKVHDKFKNIVGTAIFEEYMLVAELLPSGQSLRLWISLDTKIFADAQFPLNIPTNQEAYTALQSNTHAVMLHVTTSPINTKNKYGSLLKSNGNGTLYSLSLESVSRDSYGYVDFEKMKGIQGIALANVVSNVYEVNMGSDKKLKSMITFNDGAKWSLLNRPDYDSYNHEYKCGDDTDKCSLHLHSFTERRNPRDSFSSSSAIGLMMGVGNVGDYLTRYEQGDTFLTRDAGVTWIEVIKGAYMYEFGNQGGIIVIVDDEQPTDHVLYSLNEGKEWQQYNFIKVGEQPIKIRDIDTLPGGLSSKFILRGINPSRVDEEVIVHLDFSYIHSRNCDENDFETWSPRPPKQKNEDEDVCLFGHKITYSRKKSDIECYIDENLKDKRQKGENCKCTDHDFECDYNYIRNATTGECELYPGTEPLHRSMAEQCAHGEKEWHEDSGYRKLESTTCEGSPPKYKVHPCPRGHSALFWIIIVLSPFVIVGILTICFINSRHSRLGYSRIGHIRLGSSIEPDSILSSIIDIFYQIRMPRIVSRLWSSIPLPGRRNRYHYSPVATDEGHEVLMDDYDQDNETL